MSHSFRIDLKVRDYECDMQGIVNNSVYQNYLEHARHEFLLEKGLDFAALAQQGINLVVTRVELNYKRPLASGDAFWVGLNMERKGRLRFVFKQEIFRASDDQLMLTGIVEGTSIDHNHKPIPLPDLDILL